MENTLIIIGAVVFFGIITIKRFKLINLLKKMLNKQLPIPSYLKGILVPIKSKSSENCVQGGLKCQCGNMGEFELLYSGNLKKDVIKKIKDEDFLVFAKCLKCGSKMLIFNDAVHGWDGVVCHADKKSESLPIDLKTWKCFQCQSESQKISIAISSQGKEDFISEAGPDFNPELWIEAFDWITIDTKCNKCGSEVKELVSFETM